MIFSMERFSHVIWVTVTGSSCCMRAIRMQEEQREGCLGCHKEPTSYGYRHTHTHTETQTP